MTLTAYFTQAKSALNLPPTTVFQSAYQFGVEASTLANLVLTGVKTATTSAYDLYEPNEALPQVGAYDVILDAHDQPVCVTQTDQVTVVPYREVGSQHAFNEGEGDRSLAYWRQVHAAFFEQEYRDNQQVFDPQTAQMVLEKFHVVYPQR